MNRGGVKSWYLYDAYSSVRMLANGTGQTTDTWTYDAWGETTSRTGVTENDYQYAGERFDQTTELYQLRARYMDPKTGTLTRTRGTGTTRRACISTCTPTRTR